MLDSIRSFFDQHFATPGASADKHTIELATAALLLEVSRSDGTVSDIERAAALGALRRKFHLTTDEATTLVSLAELEVGSASDTYQFTSLVNRNFTRDQKIRVVELMWEVAYADGGRSVFEDHVIRKLADLLYVDHGDYIAAKLKARDATKGA